MEMLYVVAMFMAVLACGQCLTTNMNIVNTTYVEVMDGKMMTASKQMNITIDKNKLSFELKMFNGYNVTEKTKPNLTAIMLPMTGPTDNTDKIESQKIVAETVDAPLYGGKLTLTYELFKKAGNVTIDTGAAAERTEVMAGDIRVTIKLAATDNFTGLENVTDLKLSFMVSGSAPSYTKATDATTAGDSYNLGGNGMLKLSKKAMVGATYAAVMPEYKNKMVEVKVVKPTAGTIEYSFFLKLADVDLPKEVPSAGPRVASLGAMLWILLLAHRILW